MTESVVTYISMYVVTVIFWNSLKKRFHLLNTLVKNTLVNLQSLPTSLSIAKYCSIQLTLPSKMLHTSNKTVSAFANFSSSLTEFAQENLMCSYKSHVKMWRKQIASCIFHVPQMKQRKSWNVFSAQWNKINITNKQNRWRRHKFPISNKIYQWQVIRVSKAEVKSRGGVVRWLS